MFQQVSVNLGNLLLSLSDAMDLADPSIALHQQRVAFIAWELGKAAALPTDAVERLFIAGLLHDAGALSLEEKITIHNFEGVDAEFHCRRSEALLSTVSWLRPAAGIVRHHHRAWNTWNESIGTPLVLESQLLVLADHLERFVNRKVFILHQDEQLAAKFASLSGTELHPDVIDLFHAIARREEFWLDMTSPRLYSLLLNHGPLRRVEIDIAAISSIGELFRNIIDFRSRFTSTHSSGVAECAAALARLAGFSDAEVDLMRVAGNFHDIGKLAVPNSILDKPDKLTKEEFAVIRQHTYFTYSIMNTIGGLQQIAEWAAFHHERLDGSGYPFHHLGGKINTGARIMAVADIFTAMAEDRPYRKGMQRDEIEKILNHQGRKSFIDPRFVDILFQNYHDILVKVKAKQDSARHYYELQVQGMHQLASSAG